jgi:hypothetical protein
MPKNNDRVIPDGRRRRPMSGEAHTSLRIECDRKDFLPQKKALKIWIFISAFAIRNKLESQTCNEQKKEPINRRVRKTIHPAQCPLRQDSQQGDKMRSKSKETRLQQQMTVGKQLQKRLALLSEKGVPEKMAAHDAHVKALKGKLNQTAMRLRAIDTATKRTEALAARKIAQLEKPLEKSPKEKKEPPQKSPETRPRKKTSPGIKTEKT